MYKNEIEIDVQRCLKTLKKRIGFIIFISIMFMLVGFCLTLNIGEDKYSATSTAYAAADTSYTDAANAVTAMNAYLDVAKSYKVCQRAALILGRGDIDATDIQGSVHVGTSAKNTGASSTITNFMSSSATIISFTATTVDPELSMEMADAMVQSYTKEMTEILHADSVKTLDTAYTYNKSYSSKRETVKAAIISAFIGVLVSCSIIVACEIFDSKVRTVREATIRGDLPVIGIIPDYKE